MARTAPVPNFPAIPGMNPGLFVLGGGGDAGGSGAGKGKGKGNKQKGSGKNKNKDAKGGGKGAGKCGKGKNGKCTNCGQNVVGGDPIEPLSGRVFTTPQTDLHLAGPTDLEFVRSYNARSAQRDVGMGFGWSHTLAWTIEVRRRSATVWQPDGTSVELELPAPGQETRSDEGMLLRRFDDRLELRDGDSEFLHVFAWHDADEALYRLTCVEDANGNRITVEYDPAGVLTQVTDTAGRLIHARSTREGRIASLMVQDEATGTWWTFATYDYDDQGDLVSVRRPGGFHMAYTYRDHLLTSQRFPTDLTFHFLYDDEGRCTESWGEYPGRKDPALSDRLPAVLADGVTPARGVYHVKIDYGADDYSEVVSSTTVQRLFGNEHGKLDKGVTGAAVTTRTYNGRGDVTSVTNTIGATTSYEYDANGRRIRTVGPTGAVIEYRRDDAGRVVELVDPKGLSTHFRYDDRDNLVEVRDQRGAVTQYEWEHRGLMSAIVAPNGARTTFAYDAHGNPVEIVEPSGARWTQTFNSFGRCTSTTDPRGATTQWVYDDALRVVAQHDPNGGVTAYEYDGMSLLQRTVSPDGGVTEMEYGGYFWPVAEKSPTGEGMRWKYDREGMVVETYNERGEVWTTEWDSQGFLEEERSFDGRVMRYAHDLEGRMTHMEDGLGRTQDLTWSDADDLIAAEYDDGTKLTFEYDERGQLVAAASPGVEVTYERDAVGDIVGESQTVDGETFTVRSTLDVMGQVVERHGSWGLSEKVVRDASCARQKTILDGLMVLHDRDPNGREVRRGLGDGAAIVSELDSMGWLSGRRVTRGPDTPPVAAGEPMWVGELPGGGIDLRYGFSPAGDVLAASDRRRGHTQYSYDLNGRLTGVEHGRDPRVEFAYDSTSNHFQTAPFSDERSYGHGDRLLQRGKTRYTWDDAGQLVEKREAGSGVDGDRVWRYEWDSRGMLRQVTLPDGDVVDFLYDAFGRRVQKRHFAQRSPVAKPELRSVTRFVWSGPVMMHEIRRTFDGGPEPHVEERTILYEDDSQVPWLQRDSRPANGSPAWASPWYAYVNDANDTPQYLVTPQGDVACELRRTPWGEATIEPGAITTTPLRFLGQYHDPETGLHYNRMRYYDPEVGRYISADPVALDEGTPNAFRYGINPIAWADPWGLHAVTGVKLTFADGTTASPPTKTNTKTGQKASFFSGYSKDYPWKSDPHCQKLKSGEAYWQSHTERKAMRWADKEAAKQGKSLEGAHLEMKGEKAPCNTCHKAMKAWSKKTGAKITYTWPKNKSRSYNGGTSKGSLRNPYSTAKD